MPHLHENVLPEPRKDTFERLLWPKAQMCLQPPHLDTKHVLFTSFLCLVCEHPSPLCPRTQYGHKREGPFTHRDNCSRHPHPNRSSPQGHHPRGDRPLFPGGAGLRDDHRPRACDHGQTHPTNRGHPSGVISTNCATGKNRACPWHGQ